MKSKLITFIKLFDYFGTNFTFKYKAYESYKSLLGGIIFIIFLISVVTYSIITLIIFFKKEKVTINYYDSQLSITDSISFHNFSYGIGFLGRCDNDEANTLFNQLFNYQFNYVKATKNNMSQKKERYSIKTHLCTYSDFYNKSTDTLDLMGVTGIYLCPDYLNNTIGGTYTDEHFDYFEITLSSNYTDEDYYEQYYNLLTYNDCKFHLFFPITSFNMNNYSTPFKYDLFDLFLQLNPIYFYKRDVFFKLQRFRSFQNIIFDTFQTNYYLDYSSFNDYNLFKSSDRFKKKIPDYEKFVRIYLRVDSKRTHISRDYDKISMLIAGISSLFSTIFLFVQIIIKYINRFYAYNSIIRKIFKFNSIEGTDTYYLHNSLQKKLKISKILKAQKMNMKNYYKFEQVKFFKEKMPFIENKSEPDLHKKILSLNHKDDKKEINQILNDKNESMLFLKNDNLENNINTININTNAKSKSLDFHKSRNSFNFKFNPLKIQNFIKKKRTSISLIYNLNEVLIYIFCNNLSRGNLSKKNKYMKKSVDNLFNNLDIHIYFSKMQMIELFNYILFEPYQNTILKFLSKPYISISSYKCNLIDLLPKLYNTEFTKQELDDFSNGYTKILEMKKKNSIEEKLSRMLNLEIANFFG